ncbi:MAG: acetate kinase [Pseudomonadota bacterium]
MLLVVNCGSSSLKLAVFDGGVQRLSARVTEIGGAARVEVEGLRATGPVPDHAAAFAQVLPMMAAQGYPLTAMTAAAHRVVHGGAGLTAACRITPETLAAIQACIPLAPLHNPANLTGIHSLAALAPELPQYASFDTAFHATNPDVATRYAIPQTEGLRRYGFHGISYAALLSHLPAALPARLLALHLGNGASLCAIRDGRSVATTMGYSPLDGLTMGTRSGSIDGNAVLRLADLHGIEGAAKLLNHHSGLLALGGHSDMRQLHAADTAEARFAVQHFCYWAIRHAGSMIAAMGGLDAVAFTGGIGENDSIIRAAILDGLGYLGVSHDPVANRQNAHLLHDSQSRVAIWTVAAQEEAQIAREANAIRAGEAAT